jgi:hypothetical protein
MVSAAFVFFITGKQARRELDKQKLQQSLLARVTGAI